MILIEYPKKKTMLRVEGKFIFINCLKLIEFSLYNASGFIIFHLWILQYNFTNSKMRKAFIPLSNIFMIILYNFFSLGLIPFFYPKKMQLLYFLSEFRYQSIY